MRELTYTQALREALTAAYAAYAHEWVWEEHLREAMSRDFGWARSVDQYQEGTLVVEVYDQKTKRMVWVGWVTARSPSRAKEAERTQAALRSITDRFPPASR